MKFGGSLAQNIDFEVANFEVLRKTRVNMLIFNLAIIKIEEEVSHEMLVFMLPRVSFRVSGFAVSMGGAAEPFVFEGVKMSKLAEVWYEMLDLRLQHVSSRVSGFPLASQCLWGKLQKHVFFKVSQDVVMSFRVAVVHFVTFPVCQKACVCVHDHRGRKVTVSLEKA